MIPELELDDRRFQDLVSEARMRITRACPEWTEHNVSDPGITLIELFAWMTEMLIYRVNRVPDKLYGRLLDLIGLRLEPPSAAEALVQFSTSGPVQAPVEMSDGTEVATPRIGEGSTVFQTTEPFTIAPVRPIACAVRRGDALEHLEAAQGAIRPGVQQQAAFGAPPAPGDAFHVGFD
jgi:predicted phage baseplate assembly protein